MPPVAGSKYWSAKEVGISTSTVIRRFSDLKRDGIVRALIQINSAKIGYSTMACFRLAIDSQGVLDGIAEKISIIPDVTGILKTSGAYDLTIFTGIKDIEHLVALETEIANIPGIREMETASLKQFYVLPYP